MRGNRFLSYAGRLLLIKSVLVSVINFWISAFKLPSKCIKELEQICYAYLWTGPVLKSTNAKVAWKDVCSLNYEGGLGIRDLKEANKVFVLTLIWRLLTGDSLWGNWVRVNLLKGTSFWEVNMKTHLGSWMWCKILKLRDVAKFFFMKELGNRRHTSFWYDKWLDRGALFDLLGDRGIINMGVRKDDTVKQIVLNARRRRGHRTELLIEIENELNKVKRKLVSDKEDVNLWRRSSGFKDKFSTKETWMLSRAARGQCSWSKSTWFSQATPKFAFMAWLAVHNRMSTMDRAVRWSQGLDPTCVLCKNADESRSHLFFECSYTSQIWEHIAKGVMRSDYTNAWSEILVHIMDGSREKKSLFCLRYAFQAVLYAVWRERNKVRHGEKLIHLSVLLRLVDKGIRNKISIMRRKRVHGMEDLMQYWFQTRC